MDIVVFSATVHRGLFIAGIVSGVIALLTLILIRPNSNDVFQFPYGERKFVSDKFIGGALISVIISGLTLTGSFDPLYTIYGLIAVAFLLVLLFVISVAYWRAFKKAILSPFKIIGALIEGSSVKET